MAALQEDRPRNDLGSHRRKAARKLRGVRLVRDTAPRRESITQLAFSMSRTHRWQVLQEIARGFNNASTRAKVGIALDSGFLVIDFWVLESGEGS